MTRRSHLLSPRKRLTMAKRHPNPWDSSDGAWMCDCADCVKMRDAWPATTDVWKPQSGQVVDFATMLRDPRSPSPQEEKRADPG
jgi:hypothetical protein